MIFSSLTFLFIFLPVFLALYLASKKSRYRAIALLAGSLFFYAWGEPLFVLVLLLLTLFNWRVGLAIDKQRGSPRAGRLAAFGVLLNLLPLLLLKMLVAENSAHFALPLGVSFYTFTAVSYLVDVRREEVQADRNLLGFANYMLFFPKLLQGPITRLAEMQDGLGQLHADTDQMAAGARRFIGGLGKKVLLADNLAVVTGKVFTLPPGELPAGLAWYGLLAYALQIYLDFSGYTDMAIGLGGMLGFKLPENFNFPYLSRSIADFWRRWHMSLMAWFRNYIFMPLEIARRREKRFRQQSNLLVVFLATGLWHGLSWNFILWGLYFGLLIVLESTLLSKWLKKIPALLQHGYTLLLVLAGWVFFRMSDLADWGPFFKALLGLNQPSPDYSLRTLNVLMYWPILLAGALLSTPLLNKLAAWSREKMIPAIVMDALLAGLLVLCTAALVAGDYQAFMYAEF